MVKVSSVAAPSRRREAMGLFKFIKEAGAKLMSGSAHAATPDNLQKEVKDHGFDTGKLNIDVQGDKVKLSGQARTQEEAEKIILSLGNSVGVAEVDTSDLKVQSPAPEAKMYTVQKGTRSGRSPRCITARARAPNTP